MRGQGHRDIFIFTGNVGHSEGVIPDFDQWLASMPHAIKLMVPGNHDYSLLEPSRGKLAKNAVLLVDEGISVMGLNIWGSPITPLQDGAFGVGAEQDRERFFSHIPCDTDVVITHSPPYGILDQMSATREHLGCRALLNAVVRVQPTLHAFGHVHGAYGTTTFGDMFFANASVVGPDYKVKNSPIVIDIVMPEAAHLPANKPTLLPGAPSTDFSEMNPVLDDSSQRSDELLPSIHPLAARRIGGSSAEASGLKAYRPTHIRQRVTQNPHSSSTIVHR